MPKIFIINLVIFLFLQKTLFSQDILVKPLSLNVNSIGAEINFFKTNDTLAYFTKISEENNNIKSHIYYTHFVNGKWLAAERSKYHIF